jgi:hypothetical protein
MNKAYVLVFGNPNILLKVSGMLLRETGKKILSI